MRYIVNESTDAQYNMAFDDFCLERLPLEEPLFYLWQNAPSVIIGMNQNPYTEVNLEFLERQGIQLARRVTGGGAVYHDLQNLNYSFVQALGPQDQHPGPVLRIAGALRSLGVNAEVGGRNDIFVDGRKVSGYARRVYKDRELIHGTLMWNVDIDTLTKVLDTPDSKLHRKGIASVRSRVTNLKDCLPQISSIAEFRDRMFELIMGEDARRAPIELSEDDFSFIKNLNASKFASPDWLFGKWEE